MGSRIKGLDGSSIGSTGAAPVEQVRRSLPAGSPAAGSQSAADNVTLTDSARQLSALSQTAQDSPHVDAARVAALQSAIDSGQYTINPERIADGLIQMDQALAALAG